jgi:hypothetical protein
MLYRALNALFALLFFFGAAVQYNDPDPIRWMAIYLAACVACVTAVVRRTPWWLPAITAVIALLWALTLAPRVFPNVRITELFAAWEMKDERVEEGREMYGLLIIFVCMSMVALTSRRQRPRRQDA